MIGGFYITDNATNDEYHFPPHCYQGGKIEKGKFVLLNFRDNIVTVTEEDIDAKVNLVEWFLGIGYGITGNEAPNDDSDLEVLGWNTYRDHEHRISVKRFREFHLGSFDIQRSF